MARSCSAVAPSGMLTSPETIACSSSAALSVKARSERLMVPMDWATVIFSAMRGVASTVTNLYSVTTVLPLSSEFGATRWSVASTRKLRTMVSDTFRGGPLLALTFCVRTRSTRSPGNTKPATPVKADTGTVTARMPGLSAAARKPRSPGLTSDPCVNG